MKAIGSTACLGSFAVNMFMASSLQLVWKMLGAIQIMVHMPMLKLSFPSNVKMTFQGIIGLANFQIIPVDSILEAFFGIKRKVSEKQGVGAFGYSSNIFSSLGMVFLGLLFFGIGLIICFFLYKIFKKRLGKIILKLKNLVFFNMILRSFLQTYLVFSLGAFLNLSQISFTTSSQLF